jgi:hypothetical protein
MNALTRRPNGTMLPGHTPNPGGRPVTAIQELRAKYLPRLDELMEELWELATPYAVGLLRPRHHRPRRRNPEARDEFPPSHP